MKLAKPITGPFRQLRTRPGIVTFRSAEQNASVLKSKSNLGDIERYKNIYIEPDKTRQERIIEANTCKIVQRLTGLKVITRTVASQGSLLIYQSRRGILTDFICLNHLKQASNFVKM